MRNKTFGLGAVVGLIIGLVLMTLVSAASPAPSPSPKRDFGYGAYFLGHIPSDSANSPTALYRFYDRDADKLIYVVERYNQTAVAVTDAHKE